MELLLRVSAAAMCTLLLFLLLRKSNPELAALLSMAAVLVFLAASLRYGSAFSELLSGLRSRFGLRDVYIRPLFKCLAAAIVSRLTADLCRDSQQTAAASAVELAGSICAFGILMPLLTLMIDTLGELL